MKWTLFRLWPGVDTRAAFVALTPPGGNLLDLGSSDGETLRHIAELRPDLRLHAVDLVGVPEAYPAGCRFQRADLQRDRLPWPDASMDAITCMHLIEHLDDLAHLLRECARLLKPGGQVYFETPHPKTVALPSPPGRAAGSFTLNFYDDRTHVRPVAIGALAQQVRQTGLEVLDSGTSRNWVFAAAHLVFRWLPASRMKFTARIHWLGWSAFLTARRPG